MHILQGASPQSLDLLLQIARTGKLARATVINDAGLANRLSEAGVPYVIYREVDSDHDSGPAIQQSPADITVGRECWNLTRNQTMHRKVNPAVYLQPYGLNELNQGRDGWLYLGMMQAVQAQGRRLAIFADSVGRPDQQLTAQGWLSEVWTNRYVSGCLTYGKAHGHLANVHEYGGGGSSGFTGNEMGSDPRCRLWFSERHKGPYNSIIPADGRMKIVRGECGSFNADIVKMGGLSVALLDIIGYSAMSAHDPDVVSSNYWSCGSAGGWEHSSIDELLPALLGYLNTLNTTRGVRLTPLEQKLAHAALSPSLTICLNFMSFTCDSNTEPCGLQPLAQPIELVKE